MPSSTPPTSVLCARSGERIFSATGNATSFGASCGVRSTAKGLAQAERGKQRRASASSGAAGSAWSMAGAAAFGARRRASRDQARMQSAATSGRAEGGDAGLGQQQQRGIGLRHQEGGDRLGAAGVARADDAGDRILRLELGARSR